MGVDRVVHAHDHRQRRQALAPLLPHVAVTLFKRQHATQRRAPVAGPVIAAGQRLRACAPTRRRTRPQTRRPHPAARSAPSCSASGLPKRLAGIERLAGHKRHGQRHAACRRSTKNCTADWPLSKLLEKGIKPTTALIRAHEPQSRDGHTTPTHAADSLAASRLSSSVDHLTHRLRNRPHWNQC